MANAVQGDTQNGLVFMGQNGRQLQWGEAAFTTTGSTCTINVRNMLQVEAVLLTPIGSLNTDETLYWSASPASGSLGLDPTGPVITIGRTGTATSGLKFSYLVIGK